MGSWLLAGSVLAAQPDSPSRMCGDFVYAELHAKTNFSFLEAHRIPSELVARAAELGYRALAVTDRNSLAGVVRARGGQGRGLETDRRRDHPGGLGRRSALWAPDCAAYGRLARLITQGRRRAKRPVPALAGRHRRARRGTFGGGQIANRGEGERGEQRGGRGGEGERGRLRRRCWLANLPSPLFPSPPLVIFPSPPLVVFPSAIRNRLSGQAGTTAITWRCSWQRPKMPESAQVECRLRPASRKCAAARR